MGWSVFNLIYKLLVKLFGGLWILKEKCNQSKNKYLIRLYENYLDSKGSSIGYNSIIEGIPIFPHGINGIFISGSAVVGKNCVIFQQVTIGSNTLPDSKNNGAPIIGDNCYIGAGAKIIGNVNIGDNVRIGANCVVFKDVPSNSVVVTQSPRIIQKEYINNKYYSIGNNGNWRYMNNGDWKQETDNEIINILSKRLVK